VERTAREIRQIYAHVLKLRQNPPAHFDPLKFLALPGERREYASATTSKTR
jgi:hypothetical protein